MVQKQRFIPLLRLFKMNLQQTEEVIFVSGHSLYGTTISILYKTGENIVTIVHIYGALAIFLLFCDHQDTKLE